MEILRKVRGSLQQKIRLIASGKGAETLQKFRGYFQTNFCNDPFPNDPISELLKRADWIIFKARLWSDNAKEREIGLASGRGGWSLVLWMGRHALVQQGVF